MRSRPAGPTRKQLAQVAIATGVLAVGPVALVWWLRASGTVTSPALAAILGVAIALAASSIGCVIWERRTGSEDLLFSELMIWGYIHRLRTQRRLASARDMIGPLGEVASRGGSGLSDREQAKLLQQLVTGVEHRDPYLHGHSRRVARHSWMIARRMGLPRAEVARIRSAAAIHDVGKIETPRAILHKAGPLTDEEFAVIKQHPGDGGNMAAILRDSELASIVRHHHERLDGSGYPDNLRAEEIPLGARIIAVADTFDAITSTRPYRPARPHRMAIDILNAEAGTKLDPAVVRAFNGHYAGRGPLALWSFVAGLPERALSWLGNGAATAASAAKVAAVTTLIGSAVITSAALATHNQARAHRPSAALTGRADPARDLVSARVTGAGVGANTDGEANSTRHATRGHRGERSRRQAVAAAAASPVMLASTGAPTPSAQDGAGTASTVADPSRSADGADPNSVEAPAGGGTARGNGEEVHGKSEEAHGKSEEAHGKSGEAHGKSEEAHGKSEEAHGKSEEAHGKSEEPHGKSEEAHAKNEEPGGASEKAHGRSDEAPGKSEQAHEAKSSDGVTERRRSVGSESPQR